MKKVVICISTRKRPQGVEALLMSVAALDIPERTKVSVVVVENDSEPHTEELVRKTAKSSGLKLDYYLEKEPGVSNARNRAVKEAKGADFCCFVDDDQTVERDWLAELMKCQQEFDADGVWGPNPPRFQKQVGKHIEKFHTPESFPYGEKVSQAYTNCLMIRRSCLLRLQGPFDRRLNFTGGEDIYLTGQLITMGCLIRYNPDALALEWVPLDRTTLRYMLKRTIRTINTKYIVRKLMDPDFNKYSILPRMLMRLAMGILQTVPNLIISGEKKYDGLLKVAHAIGGLSFIFGWKNTFYKQK